MVLGGSGDNLLTGPARPQRSSCDDPLLAASWTEGEAACAQHHRYQDE